MVEISWACTMHACNKEPIQSKAKQLSTEKPFGKKHFQMHEISTPFSILLYNLSDNFRFVYTFHENSPPSWGSWTTHACCFSLFNLFSHSYQTKVVMWICIPRACFGFCQIEQRACVLNKQQHFVFLIWDPRNALTAASSYLKLKKQLNLSSVSIEKCFKEGTSIHSKTIIYIYINICVACICTCMSEMLGLARSKQWSKDNDCLD